MKIEINILNILWIIGASQGMLLGILLFLKKNKRINLPLTVFIVFSSFEILFKFIYDSNLIFKYPHLLYLTEPLSMLSGPLIFLYVRNRINNKSIYRATDLLFFVPFLIYTVYYIPTFLESAEDKLYDYQLFVDSGIVFSENIIEWIAEIIVAVSFMIFAILNIAKYQVKIKQYYSELENINLKLLKRLLLLCIIIYSIEVIIIILAFFNVSVSESVNNWLYVMLVFAIYFIGYDGIFLQKNIQIEEVINEKSTVKYEKTLLSDESIDQMSSKLIKYMRSNKPYLNPEIRIKDLAIQLDEQPYLLSQLINDKFNMNFYDFINKYRVEDAKSVLCNPKYENYTITAIGFEVGFNSKSAFYSAFKKNTGITPAKFQSNKQT